MFNLYICYLLFDIVLEEQTDEARETLVQGYNGVLEGYDATVDDVEEIFEGLKQLISELSAESALV